MAKVTFLDGGYDFCRTLTIMALLKKFSPEKRAEYEKKLESEDPNKWNKFKKDFPSLFEK
ncbi:MAG: hypothetical protein LBR24_04240 [Methanobrevibacter sp.]|jgi:hypothetical protein|nr:hypothetical protein [Methanobrevibacter sp.]